MSAERGPRRLGEDLDRVMGGLSAPARRAGRGAGAGGAIDGSISGITALFAHWDRLVGSEIAAHARPMGVQGDRLVVVTDDPAWGAELRWLADDLVARIAAGGGPRLVGLRIRVRRR